MLFHYLLFLSEGCKAGVIGFSYLVYDFPWLDSASRFSYALGETVEEGFLLFVI